MKKIFICIMLIAVILTAVASAAPGDNNDPIVVLSYLNQRINTLINEKELDSISDLKSEIEKLKGEPVSTPADSSFNLEVVEIHVNEKLIAESGTELILRGGEAFVIASEMGGLANVTSASDLGSGYSVPHNNLLIVPRSDGRGVYTNDYAIFMVRGKYSIAK